MRTVTLPGSRSSRPISTNSARIFLSASVSLYALNRMGVLQPFAGMRRGCREYSLFRSDSRLLHDARPLRGFGADELAELLRRRVQHLGALELEALARFLGSENCRDF